MTISVGNEHVKLELADSGDGWFGPYDRDDPNDVPLLRFTLLIAQDDEWTEIMGGSHCTRIPASTANKRQMQLAADMFSEVADAIMDGQVIHGLCDRLSWTDEIGILMEEPIEV